MGSSNDQIPLLAILELNPQNDESKKRRKEERRLLARKKWEKRYPFICSACKRKFYKEEELFASFVCPDCLVRTSREDDAYNNDLWQIMTSP